MAPSLGLDQGGADHGEGGEEEADADPLKGRNAGGAAGTKAIELVERDEEDEERT